MQVTAWARGWLNLIGALEQGKGIGQASDALVPVVDVAQMLSLDRRATQRPQISSLVSGIMSTMVSVPPGEVWIVRSLAHAAFSAAGQTILGQRVVYRTAPGTSITDQILSDSFNLAVTDYVCKAVPCELILRGGDQLGLTCQAIVGTPTSELSVTYDVLDG